MTIRLSTMSHGSAGSRNRTYDQSSKTRYGRYSATVVETMARPSQASARRSTTNGAANASARNGVCVSISHRPYRLTFAEMFAV